MERKIGEVIEYQSKKLRVEESKNKHYGCDGCFFDGKCLPFCNTLAGKCHFVHRSDYKEIIFVEITEEQPQELTEQPQEQAEQQTEQPQKLNLCEILKYCPQGETFWSPMLDGVKFSCIDDERQMIIVETVEGHFTWEINADGTISIDEVTSPEIMLYPSKEQRDWTKVKYEKKKELPKTWKDFCKNYPCKKDECYMHSGCGLRGIREGAERQVDCDRNILPSKQAAEAHLALMQLHQLRDAWREGWVPDWNDGGQNKYVIAYDKGEFEIWQYHTVSRFLAFQDEKRAGEFKDCFIDLIRKAGDLI